MIGDPSGRTDMRTMMTRETVQHNIDCIKKQMEKFIDFSDGKAILANNADWLWDLNYIEFIRDIGSHFSVNRMLAAECFKSRMENGLSFLEFNYMLMQGYDFLVLNKKYGCVLELGGDDQWSNMIAGVELIRKKEQKSAFAMTCTLLTNKEGKKMGKTAKGALWLDPEKTSPYEFYQYWRNVDDADVEKCLSLLTFVPMEEVRRLVSFQDERINEAKKVLAFEITKMIHGEEEALKSQKAAEALFSGGADLTTVPKLEVSIGEELLNVLVENKVLKTKSEGRRLMQQGAMTLENVKMSDPAYVITEDSFSGDALLKLGKKKFYQLVRK